MFIGHYGPAFIAAADPRAPRLGTLFVAAQLIDFGFFGLMLADVEHMRLVPGITAMNPMDLYDMPWTHSLAGTLGWAAGLALLLRWWLKRWAAAAIGAAVVVSHWLLDLLVHAPDLTLAGSPPRLGLGLWNHPAIEMPLEAVIAFGGLIWFQRRTRPRAGRTNASLIALALLMAALMLVGWFAPQPTEVTSAIPVTALTGYTLLALGAWWAGATRERRA